MTIRFIKQWNGNAPDAIVTMAGAEETRLINLGFAVADLDGQQGPRLVNSEINDLTGGIEVSVGGNKIRIGDDRPVNSGMPLWNGNTVASLFTISGQSSAAVTTEATSDGGLRVYTDTADRYIDLVMVLPTPLLIRSAALDVLANADQNQVSVYFGQDASFSAATMIARSLTVSGSVETHRTGLRQIMWCSGTKSSAWTNSGALDLDTQLFTHARIRISPSAGKIADATIYGLRINPAGRSRIAVISDDGYSSWVKYGQQIFNRRGIPTAQAIIQSTVGLSANYCSLDQLKSFVAAGNECVTHGPGDSQFVTFADRASRIKNVTDTRDYLAANGLIGSKQAKCYVYPGGKFQASIGDSSFMDDLIAAGFTFARTVTRFMGFSADLIKSNKYAAMTVPIIGYIRQSTEAADTQELADTLASIDYCAQNGIDCVVMLHNVIPAQGVWTWTQTTDITVDKLVQIADKIVQCRKDYGQEPVLFSSFAP